MAACTETGIGLTINILLLHFHTVSTVLIWYKKTKQKPKHQVDEGMFGLTLVF